MKKNKKLLVIEIVAVLAVCLILALIISTNMYKKSEVAKEEVQQASDEQNGALGDQTENREVSMQSEEPNSSAENGVSV